MANLDTIYNENYGSTVVTNGDFIAIGNPPWKKYSQCEGFSRIGQVFLIKNDRFNSKYPVIKTYTKKFSTENGYLPTYYTEQSSSTSFTASFTKDDGYYNDTSTSCSYLVIEDDNIHTYQSNYGSSIDMCDYFLAIGDTGVTASFYTGYTSSFASVDIYVINSNYTYDTSNGIMSSFNDCDSESNSQLDNSPVCVITGSISEHFGKTVSITNNYLAVGAPNYNSGRGCVYIYKYVDSECIYQLQSTVSCSLTTYPLQYNFGSSICLDKATETTLVVGSNQLSQSNVYIFISSSNGWQLKQTLSQNTSSNYYKLNDANFDFVASGSQINSRYGYSVSIHKNLLAVGAPNDLIYWEYSGSNVLRQRGSVYLYTDDICNNSEISGNLLVNYTLLTKVYGDSSTFKDNLFGFSVSTHNNKVLIGSPKPYFPFSSIFISSSIDFYDNTFDQTDFGESTYCGQTLLYYVTNSNVVQLTTTPISKRKELGKPYNAFGYSVSVSDDNLVIGAPIPLNDDFHLQSLIITESGSASQPLYKLTSSYQSEDCYITSSFVLNQLEECISCDFGGPISGAISGAIGGVCDNLIIFVNEDGDTQYVSSQIFGMSYIYDMKDLQKNHHVGNVFYNNNKIVINNTGSILKNLTLDPTDFNNSYLYMDYQSQMSLHEKQYICTIEPGEFNVSTNPSAITSSYFEYDILNKNVFDFNNLDIIMRYLNYRITNNSSEKWWLNFVSGDVDESVFNYYTSSFTNYDDNRLTQTIKDKFCDVDLDINNDGVTNNQDAEILWKYFINDLTINNYQNYLNPRAKRTNYDNIVGFLNEKTGKFNTKLIKQEFFNFNYSSSIDITGSYLAPYITTVGLYSDQGELVAVAKLAQPIKNTSEIPINIVVKWDT
jgi:hypothetical protein